MEVFVAFVFFGMVMLARLFVKSTVEPAIKNIAARSSLSRSVLLCANCGLLTRKQDIGDSHLCCRHCNKEFYNAIRCNCCNSITQIDEISLSKDGYCCENCGKVVKILPLHEGWMDQIDDPALLEAVYRVRRDYAGIQYELMKNIDNSLRAELKAKSRECLEELALMRPH